MKKKIFSIATILCVALSLCFVLTGCQQKVNPEGSYHVKSVSITIAGTTTSMDYDTYQACKADQSQIENVMTFAIFSAYFESGLKIYYGGTAEMTSSMNGTTQTISANWSVDGNQLTLTSAVDAEDPMVLTMNGIELSMVEDSNPQMPVSIVWVKD